MTRNAPDGSPVLICTDSNALCQALLSKDTGEIAQLYEKLSELPITLIIYWVPVHVNIPGNELADCAAKRAARIETEPIGVSFQSAKQMIKRNIRDPPPDPIKYSNTRQVYDFYKLKNDEGLTSRADQTLIAKIRTGKWRKFRA